MDVGSDRILFTRWWFNRHRAANLPAGITTDPALAIARDTVNLWQAMSIAPQRSQAASRRRRSAPRAAAPWDTSRACWLTASLLAVYAAQPRPLAAPGRGRDPPARARFDGEHRLAGALVAGARRRRLWRHRGAGPARGLLAGRAPGRARAVLVRPRGTGRSRALRDARRRLGHPAGGRSRRNARSWMRRRWWCGGYRVRVRRRLPTSARIPRRTSRRGRRAAN